MSSRRNLRDKLQNHLRPSRIAECSRVLRETLGLPESEIGFLPLDATESIRSEMGDRLRHMRPQREFTLDNRHAITQWIESIAKQLARADRVDVLFHERDQETGAAVIPLECAAQALWPMRDAGVIADFEICDAQCRHGICLDFGFYTSDGDYYVDGICQAYEW